VGQGDPGGQHQAHVTRQTAGIDRRVPKRTEVRFGSEASAPFGAWRVVLSAIAPTADIGDRARPRPLSATSGCERSQRKRSLAEPPKRHSGTTSGLVLVCGPERWEKDRLDRGWLPGAVGICLNAIVTRAATRVKLVQL